ncbi:hypothetical protein PPERSA_08941 [Pseudocohnilembus persalinus]|uniref:Insulin-like growth factor binding protein, N-terminal n=1 Tax=Pseudocohnilembus persalinus TaxID=266149 RepID=A0A0V0R3N5_PSEPJ|nr:hypothetical protein PPERSA_08941 [Pseudocohnilembus persalinus]|eukprot:KRX08837.1 hypothetical protein PPERSA_08941 [Pseudocohnilembus persalinus]
MIKQVLIFLAIIFLAQSCGVSQMMECGKKITLSEKNCLNAQNIQACLYKYDECNQCVEFFLEKYQQTEIEPLSMSFECQMKKGVCKGHCDKEQNSAYCMKMCMKMAGCA